MSEFLKKTEKTVVLNAKKLGHFAFVNTTMKSVWNRFGMVSENKEVFYIARLNSAVLVMKP